MKRQLHSQPLLSFRKTALLILTTAAIGCQPPESDAPGSLPGAREVVEEPGFTEGLQRLGLESELTVDGFVSDLGAIRWFGASSGGTLAVSQGEDHLVRLLDFRGVDLGSVGGPGGPPGGGLAESQAQGGAGWIGDTLWVNDVTLARIVLYTKDGERLRLLPPLAGARPKRGEEDRFPVFLNLSPLAVYPGDSLLAAADQPVGGPASDSFAEGVHLLRVTSDGIIQDHVLGLPDRADRFDARFGRPPPSPGTPLAAPSHYSVAPNGDRAALITTDAAGSEDGTWFLQLVDAHGRVQATRRFPFRAGSYTTAVVVGSDGRIWVQLDGGSDTPASLVLSPEGRPVALLPLPEDVRLLAADKTHLWTECKDDLGVPTLVRYRIVDAG